MTPLDTNELTGERLRPVLIEAWFPRSPSVGWHAVSLRGTETISSPYEFDIELSNDDPTADYEELLGVDCELLLDRNGSAHVIYGIVAEVEMLTRAETHGRAEHAGSSARIRLVPAFALLDQVVDTRFFAGQTVPEILRDVLTPVLADYERKIDCESYIKAQYNRRDYCVQFRESLLAFCSRIMEEEGIAYLFLPDDEAQRETMVLVDNNEDFQAAELLMPGPVPVVFNRAEELDRESIQAFDWRRARATNRVVARGYNMKSPRPVEEGHAEQPDAQRPVVREVQLHGEHRQIIDDPINDPEAQSFTGADLAQRGPLATRLLQRHTLESAVGRGRSNAVGFAVGRVFRLGDHPDAAFAQHKFVLVRVSHEADDHTYTNRFECIPFEQPFRPAVRTPRPRAYGVQTGVVVGRVQDEVYTDQYGRVRVKLHSDRHSPDDEHASCWIRVAQAWAGAGYGAMVIPRVGMEVIVSFVDGNPDRPIVTGCVYNGANMPPYGLPGELSKSTFKTHSSPGGDGFNELRFEDAQGSEQIFVHAQRRMDLRVRGSLFETAAGSREERIGGGQDGERHGDHNTLVHKDVNHHIIETRYTKVDKEQYTTIAEDVIEDYQTRHMVTVGEISQLSAPRIVVEASEYVSHKADELELAGSSTVSIKGGGKVVVESNNAIEFKVGGSFISITPDGIDIQGLMLRLNSGGGVGSATEGIPALAVDVLDPLDALAADDGRPGSSSPRGGGGGGRRTRNSRTLEPHHAPPMKPPPPKRPGRPVVLPDGTVRQLLSIAWFQVETWCSEPATLWGTAQNYEVGDTELVTITNVVDGAVQRAFELPLKAGMYKHAVDVVDLLPGRTALGYEAERELNASVAGLTTAVPIRLRFITNLPRMRYTVGRARFEISMKDSEVVIGGTVRYVRGHLYYVIKLGKSVTDDTKGKIGVRFKGHTDWRYCKAIGPGDDAEHLVYWNGTEWTPVPLAWDELNLKDKKKGGKNKTLSGMGVWKEGGVVKTQYGNIPWPGPVKEWHWHTTSQLEAKLAMFKDDIERHWSGRFDLKRQSCRSHDDQCCRYKVRCSISFEESDMLVEDAIIFSEEMGRANADVWPLFGEPPRTVVHEFGHHLGNPDEYKGASTVDPTVNGDGAKSGIDAKSIMGNGTDVRRRHFDTVCEALSELVGRETGQNYTYNAVPVIS